MLRESSYVRILYKDGKLFTAFVIFFMKAMNSLPSFHDNGEPFAAFSAKFFLFFFKSVVSIPLRRRETIHRLISSYEDGKWFTFLSWTLYSRLTNRDLYKKRWIIYCLKLFAAFTINIIKTVNDSLFFSEISDVKRNESMFYK